MLPYTDTPPCHNRLTNEHASMIKAIEDIFRGRQPAAPGSNTNPDSGRRRSITRLPISMLQKSEDRMHYELLNVVPIRDSLAVVQIQQTPLDMDGRRMEEATTSPLLVIAKSGDEWEMVGLPLPRHCLLQAGDNV